METVENKLEYDAENDFRFPVRLLYKALYILEKYSYTSFYNYCRHVDMPAQDIERVENKYKYKTDPEFRKKIHGILANIEKETGRKMKELRIVL